MYKTLLLYKYFGNKELKLCVCVSICVIVTACTVRARDLKFGHSTLLVTLKK